MASDVLYDKTLPDRIIDLLKASEFGNFFKFFIYGDPIIIPYSAMPCVTVDLTSTEIIQGPTGMDYVKQTVMVKLIINRSTEFDFQNEDSEVAGQRTLEEMVQGIDVSTLQYDTRTIAGILRQNFTLGNYATDQNMRIRYIGLKQRDDDTFAMESEITFAVDTLLQVPNRV